MESDLPRFRGVREIKELANSTLSPIDVYFYAEIAETNVKKVIETEVWHFITTIERGGAENQLLILAKKQVSFGYRVKIVYLKGQGTLFKDFSAIGCDVFLLRRFLASKATKDLMCKNRNKHLTIHCHLPRAEIVGYLISKFARRPLIITRHNAETFITSGPTFLSSWASRFITRKAHTVICISETVRDFVILNNEVRDSSKCRIIYYGYPEERTKKKLNQIQKESKIVTLFTAARLVPQKNLFTLVDSIRFLPENYHLKVAGFGPLHNDLTNYINRLHLSSRVFLIGKIDSIDELLNQCNVFVLSSRYEGFGLVLLEAMASNCKIAASNIKIVKEVLGDGYKYLFDPDKPQEIATCLIKLHTSTEDFSKIWKSRLEKFSDEKMALEIDDAYARAR